MSGLAQALAARCAPDWGERFSVDERAALQAIVRTAFIDTAACILAGRREPATLKALAWARRHAHGPGEAGWLFGHERAPAATAALVNGVAGHALDYDDVGLAGHPSVVLVPALLAEQERSGVQGLALCQAYAKGYAVWGELQRRMKTGLHARGWHPTAIFGVPAVAAALASTRALDAATTAHALGIAASMASGVVANFGSMTKPLHIGLAAEAGFRAVDLAALGVDASPDALDGRAGLLAALVGMDQVDLAGVVPEGFEATVLDQRPGIKKYPICYATHRVVDGVLDLTRGLGLRLEDVARVDVTVSETAAGVLRHHRPATLSEARFSIEFAVATALLYQRVGLQEVSEATLADARVGAFLPRVHTHTSDTRCPLEPSFAFTDEVTITLADGRTLASGPIRFARGHAQRPLGEHELREKLAGCVAADEAHRVMPLLAQIDSILA